MYLPPCLESAPLLGAEVAVVFRIAVSSNFLGVSLVCQVIKNLPAMQETWF